MKMKIKSIYLAIATVVALVLPSCSSDEPGSGIEPNPTKYKLAGRVEKGPFVQGSTVSVQPLNGALSPVGSIFNGEITDNAGSFDIGQVELDYSFARLTASGYFFNEVSGSLSSGTITLNSIVDLANKTSVNVNLLTHLKAQRIQKLVGSGKSFTDADAQAQLEVLTQFGLQRFKDTDFSAATIADGSDGAGVIIAVSSLLLNNRSEAEFTEYLSVLSSQLANNGKFDDDIKAKIYSDSWSIKSSLDNIADNIISRYNELGRTVTVPDLRFFFDWNNDGIAGNETIENPQVSLSQTEVHFDKNGGTAEIIVTANLPLTLELPKDPNEPDNPSVIGPGDIFGDGFYANIGNPIHCETTYADGKLTIKVAKSERKNTQKAEIYLYDYMGQVQGNVTVTLDGDPTVKTTLSETGKKVVDETFKLFTKAISWSYYIERGYTGMYDFHGVKAPLSPSDSYNSKAYSSSYHAIATINQFISALNSNGEYLDALPYFQLLRAIIFTDMADKWGNIGYDYSRGDYVIPQATQREVLRYAELQLDEISYAFADTKAVGTINNPQAAFDMPKDVWRIAKANVYLQLEDYNSAASLLQIVIDGHRYSLNAGNDYTQSSSSILLFAVPNEVVNGHTLGFYTYSDVLLARAKCYLHSGDSANAKKLVNQVASAKGITVSDNVTTAIETLSKELYTPRYFAFQKRNSLGGYAEYQKLWPIPSQEIALSGWRQNPGY